MSWRKFTEDEARKMLHLHEEQGLTYGQIAIRFGTSKTVVARLIKKARGDRDASNAS